MSHSVAPPLEIGTELAGFRLERMIGRGSLGIVYEATQVSLDRRVALKLLPADSHFAERLRRLRWPEHPNAVSMYAAGVCEHGEFIAMQLVRGRSLAELRDAGLEPAEVLDHLRDVAMALDAAHREGIVHGAIGAQNVLVDGDDRALLSDFGLDPGDATAASDRRAFAALVQECLDEDLLAFEDPSSAVEIVRLGAAALPPSAVQSRGRHRWPWLVACAIGTGAAVAVLAVVLAGAGKEPERAPPMLPGTQPIGSALPAAGTSSVDCRGRPPSGASPACTVLQTRLPGRDVLARRNGVIRRWAVRGARGTLALQVLRRRGDEFAEVARSGYEQIPDEGVHAIAAKLPVRARDLVGVEVTPGAAIGVRSSTNGTSSARWIGPLNWRIRPVESGATSGLDGELLLRVEYAPGAQQRPPGTLTGREAELAIPGRELGTQEIGLSGRELRRLAVVRVRDRIAIDLFGGERRLERLVVEGAKGGGRLLSLSAYGAPVVGVQWRNPDGRTIAHSYAVRASSIVQRD